MLTRNMKVSIRPTSAWNLSGENTQVATPIASVTPVKKIAAPVTRSAPRYACCTLSPRPRNSCMRLKR
jgi:hypothetical protein